MLDMFTHCFFSEALIGDEILTMNRYSSDSVFLPLIIKEKSFG